MGFPSLPREDCGQSIASRGSRRALSILYLLLSSIFNVWWQKMRKSRIQGRWESQERKYSQMEGNWVLEVDTPGFKFQFCSSPAVRTYSTSLSLNSLSSKIILVAKLLWEVNILLKSVQPSVNGATVIIIITTDIKATFIYHQRTVGLCLYSPCTSQRFLHFLPSLPNTARSTIAMLIFLLVKDRNDLEQSQQKVHI